MKDKVTSLDVARRAGVSRSAVSRVFTPGASASAETARKVREAADALGYRPNSLARAVVTGRSRIIGLVVAGLDNQFYPGALEQLSIALQAEGYHLLVFMSAAGDGIARTIEDLLAYQVDGIVAASVEMSNDLVSRCEEAGIPVVMFNRRQDDPRLSAVVSDNFAGGRAVAQFLIAGGHERVAHIAGWQEASTGRDRAAGLAAGLADQGLSAIAVEDARFDPDRAAQIAREIVNDGARPDAIFVGGDRMAFAVMDTLRFELGLGVPDDISVVGYDDVPLAGWPAYDLTTLRQPVERMIGATVDMLLDRIEEGKCPRQEALPGQLVIRGSARRARGWKH